MPKRPRLMFVLWLLTAAFCVGLVTNLAPALRGDVPWLPGNSGWRWPYELPRWQWLLPCVLGVGLYLVGAVHLLAAAEREGHRFPLPLILWAFGGAALLPLLLLTLEGRPLFLLFARSASTVTGGYQYAAALVTDLGDTLRQWPQFVMEYRKQIPLGGVALSPPGLTAVYYVIGRAFDSLPPLAQTFDALVRPLECQYLHILTWSNGQMASVWLQILMPVWVALGVAPLYRLAGLVQDRRVARWAVIFWPLVPSLSIFAPRFNTFYVLVAVVMLSLLWFGLERRRLWLVALSGFVFSVTLFFNLSVIPLGILGGFTIIGHWLMGGRWSARFGELLRALIAFGLGSVSVWAVYSLLSGVSILDIIGLGYSLHSIIDRPYAPWLFMHTYDTFLFVGVPITALVVWRLWQLIRRRHPLSRSDVFIGAGTLTLAFMVISGTARGETGRVWMFFAPVWILAAAEMLVRFDAPKRAAVLVMQAFCLVSMAAVLRANFTALTVPPTPPPADRGPMFPINAQFQRSEDRLTLVGLDAEHSAQDILLRLYWRADGFVSRPYVLSMIPVRPDRSLLPSLNWDPLNWDYPPSCWAPGQVFVDTVVVPLGDKGMPGDWLFSLSVTDVVTHEPMLVGGQPQVGIGPVHIPAR